MSSQLPSLQQGCYWPRMLGQKVMLVCAVLLLTTTKLGHQQPRSPVISLHLSPTASLISRILHHFQDLSSSQVLYFPPFPAPIFFPRPPLFGSTSFWQQLTFLEILVPGFPNANCLPAGAQCMISLLTGGPVWYLSIHWMTWNVPLLFSPGATKFTTSLSWQWLATLRLLPEHSKDQLVFHTHTLTHIHPIICPLWHHATGCSFLTTLQHLSDTQLLHQQLLKVCGFAVYVKRICGPLPLPASSVQLGSSTIQTPL